MISAQRKSSPVVAQHAAPVVILVALTMLLPGCAARRIHDYVFTVTGAVTAEDNVPVEAADVTLDVTGPVYDGIEPVRNRHSSTGPYGEFVFAYISHQAGVKYTITVRKNGFEPEIVSGAAPPNGNYAIKLKRPSEATKGDPALSHYPLPTAHHSLSPHV